MSVKRTVNRKKKKLDDDDKALLSLRRKIYRARAAGEDPRQIALAEQFVDSLAVELGKPPKHPRKPLPVRLHRPSALTTRLFSILDQQGLKNVAPISQLLRKVKKD